MVHPIPRADKRETTLQNLLDKYTTGLKPATAAPPRPTGPGHEMHIIISGSTGSMGSHLLHHLIVAEGVTKIYCLNRAEDGQQKQKESNSQRGLRDQWNPDKVKFIHVDMSKPKFDLDAETYEMLSGDATHFIHLQWPVDFVNSVHAFESHLQGVRNIIDFSVTATKRPSILFTSSIAVAPYWSKRHPGKQVPEAPIHDLAVAELGYGESKLVAELMLEKAGHVCGTHSTVLRIGHIAGPIEKDGFWNKAEWIPTVHLNNVDWIPVDVLSDIVIELIHSETGPLHAAETKNGSCLVYNAVNPQDTTWTDLVPTINSHLHDGQLKEVPFEEWVDHLLDAAGRGQSVQGLPALKLIDFYEICMEASAPGHEMPKFDTSRACQSSDVMAKLQPVSHADMAKWMEQWEF